jgi:sec-independent protein translocase protein TatC
MGTATALRIATVAVLALLLGGIVAALRLRRPGGEGDVPRGIWDHVEELRRRLLGVAGTFVAGLVVALTVRVGAWRGWPVPVPDLYDTLSAQIFRAAAQHLVPPGVQLIVTTPMDGFMAQFYLAVGFGVAWALPVALYQAARFFGPALRERERRFLALALVPATLLFLLGALFGYLLVLPVTFSALYQFSDALGARGLLTVADFSSFTLSFLVGFGLAFQTPLVMAALSRVGLVAPRTYVRFWRHAVVAILIVAMVVTPDPTILSQLMLAIPLIALYGLGVLVALAAYRARRQGR